MQNSLSLKNHLLAIINNDKGWSKAQTITQELTGGRLSLIDATGTFIGDEQHSDFCRWLQSSPIGKKRCRECHLENAFDKAYQSEKSRLFRCHAGLTHFTIRLSPQVAVLSSGVLCCDFDTSHYVQFVEEVGLSPDKGFVLLDQLHSTGQMEKEQLLLTLELVESLLQPLEVKLSELIYVDLTEEKILQKPLKVVHTHQIETPEANVPPLTILRRRKREGRRVVITGIGVVSPIGVGNEAFLDGLLTARNGVRRITFFDPSDLPSQMAGEVHDFDPREYMDAKSVSHTARASRFAIAGTKMALEDARLVLEEEDTKRISVIIGAGTNGIEFAAQQCHYFYTTQGKRPVNPYTGVIVFAGACSGEVSMRFGLKGWSHTISTGCSSSNDAIGCSLRFIRSGEADMIVTGGTDAAIIPMTVSAFASMRALSRRNDLPEEASRPFDKERDGFVLGEGAAIFLLEELEHALARGARIYAEVLGYGATNDAYHMTKPSPDGVEAARAIYLALEDAKLSPSDIDYVNAHGSSTPLNDKTETKISRMVFGKHAYSDKFAISSTKSLTGHALGAASAIGLSASLLGMEHGFLPPTINYKLFDPECDLNYIPNEPEHRQIQFFLSNSFAFGGKNSCLILGKFLDNEY